MMYGTQAAFISAGGYHHHIGLNTWHSKGAPPASPEGVGLYHTAILYPTRKDLAAICERLIKANYPLTGASDHGVSEAIYLDDPDGNGVELYWDRAPEHWPKKSDGSLEMFTRPLDLHGLIKELQR
jgi:catechol 2,3-dioxygenase